MKVNHAGEQGAISIYTGQIFVARLTASHLVPELQAFRAHEQERRDYSSVDLGLLSSRRTHRDSSDIGPSQSPQATRNNNSHQCDNMLVFPIGNLLLSIAVHNHEPPGYEMSVSH